MQAFTTYHVTAITKGTRVSPPGSLCSRRALLSRTPTRKKRPRSRYAVVSMSMFIWSNDGIFGDKDKDNEDDKTTNSQDDDDEDDDDDDLEDEDDDEDVPVSEHPVFGKTWAYGPTKNTAKSILNNNYVNSGQKRDDDEREREDVQKIMDSLFKMTKGPDDIDRIRAQTGVDASDAFRRIVLGIFGSVPGDAFEVVVNTDIDGVTRLMQSSLATGYALRNAEWRMTISENYNFATYPASPTSTVSSSSGDDTDSDTAKPGNNSGSNIATSTSTKNVQGEVEWWDSALDTKVSMSVQEYITKLEGENELLKERLRASKAHSVESNKILDYMRSVSPDRISVLQKDISSDVLEMFRMVIRKILGEIPNDKVDVSYSTSRDWISQLCFWCCLVGYHVRNLEKKLEMNRMLAVESTADADIVQSSPTPTPKENEGSET